MYMFNYKSWIISQQTSIILVDSLFFTWYRIYSKKNIEIRKHISIIGDFVPGLYYTLAFEWGCSCSLIASIVSKLWGFVCLSLVAPNLSCRLKVLRCVVGFLQLTAQWLFLEFQFNFSFMMKYFKFWGWGTLSSVRLMFSSEVRSPPHWKWQSPWEPQVMDCSVSAVMNQNGSDASQNPICLHMEESVFQKQ